jgi:ABC-2 type transport system permease protein
MTRLAQTAASPLPLSIAQMVSAALSLLVLSVGRLCQGKRVLVVAFLFAVPAAFAILARYYNGDMEPDQIEFSLIFMFIPHALVPLAALLFAAGMIQDEVEEQTLTYILVRPIPRPLVYLIKLLATLFVSAVLVDVMLGVTLAAIYWGSDRFLGEIMPNRFLWMAAALDLALLAYCGVFGLLGLLLKRTLVWGVTYILIFEGVIANIPYQVRKATVMLYYRVLSMRWVGLEAAEWQIDLGDAPDARTCVWALAGAALAATVVGAIIFSAREFRLKTPEGS